MVKISKPFITTAEGSPAYWQIGNLWQIMATGVLTDNAFTLLDQIVHDGGGGGPTTHTHTQDEGLYVISGKCTFNAGGHQGLQGTPGTFVSVPGNTEHSFTVDKPDTHILNFYLPAGFEQLLIGIAHPARERKTPDPSLVREMLPPRWLADKLCDEYGQDNRLGVNTFVDGPDPEKMITKPTPGATLFPFTANAKDLSSYVTMGGCWTVLADGKQTGGTYTLLELLWAKGTTIKPRLYRERDEMLYLISGKVRVLLNDRFVEAEKGSLVYIPSGTVYGFHVLEEASCLNLHTKSGFEELIQMVGTEGKGERRVPDEGFREKEIDAGARTRLLDRIGLQELAVTAVNS